MHDAVEGNMLVISVQKHVGYEPPNLSPPVRVVDEVGADQPFALAKLVLDAHALGGIQTEKKQDRFKTGLKIAVRTGF